MSYTDFSRVMVEGSPPSPSSLQTIWALGCFQDEFQQIAPHLPLMATSTNPSLPPPGTNLNEKSSLSEKQREKESLNSIKVGKAGYLFLTSWLALHPTSFLGIRAHYSLTLAVSQREGRLMTVLDSHCQLIKERSTG